MAAEGSHEPARDPEDLERLLVSRQGAGDVDGMVALYEPNGVLDLGGGRLPLGRQSERSTRDWWQRVENLLLEITAHALSRETWHSHQLAFRMAA